MEHKANEEKGDASAIAKLAGWFDSRLGLSYEFLRPVPDYAINPFYWLGALAVVAFVIEGITGMIMMLYYVPNPTQAYSTTMYIFQNVSYGRFLETVHLYTAYAMIFLSVMHLMRGYFVSVHKKPREVMWLTGMIMGFVVLGMGFTGYLLPWTVVSKSATDVGIGLISALPPGLSTFLNFLLVGAGGDTTVLLHFFDLHVVVLPAVLLVLLLVKMFMLEAHGISEPTSGMEGLAPKKRRLVPIFPDVSFYLFELGALFGAGMLLISVIFPLELPAEYTPLAAAGAVTQPDWYFLWMYQILKISAFEGGGLTIALSIITLIFVGLLVLPFVDRSREKRLSRRSFYVTLGVIFVAELIVLSVWGYLTPGLVIPDEQAAVVIGGTALGVAVVSALIYRMLYRGLRLGGGAKSAAVPAARATINSATVWTAGVFVALLAGGAFTMGNAIQAAAALVMSGPTAPLVLDMAASLAGLTLVLLGTMYLVYRLDLGLGSIKRRVKAFEVGWKAE